MHLRELKIEITNRCLLNCLHCSTCAHANLNSFLPLSTMEDLIFQAQELGCHRICFSGGEPLLHPDLLSLFERVSSGGGISRLYTTGIVDVAPPSEITSRKLTELKASGLSHLVFSLYSARPSVHDSITLVPGSFAATVRAMKKAIQLDITTEIHFVAVSKIIKELPLLADFAERMGVRKISILRFVPQGRGEQSASELVPGPDDLKNLRNIIRNLREQKFNLTFRLGSPFNFLLLNSPTPCTTGSDRMLIDADGFAYPCDALKQVKAADKNNNVLEHSLSQILENAPLFQLVRNAAIPQACQSCSDYKYCLGGCLAQRLLVGQDLSLQLDPACLNQDETQAHESSQKMPYHLGTGGN
jgi:radical SAM protein with 4Fe4S-binding SPASM domain